MSTITIPATVVPRIRSGAQLQIGGAAEQLAGTIDDAMMRGVAPLCEWRRLLRAWALVDLLGWPDETCGPVELDVHEHGEGLRWALQGNVDRLAHLLTDQGDDTQRARREGDLQALREFESAALRAIESDQQTTVTATMPGEVVELLRGALYADLERACEDMPSTEPKTRASWAGVLRRIEHTRRGLDVIGWAAPSEQQPLTLAIDATMIEALERDAEQWGWASEQVRIESAEGRARAASHVATIERFLASLAERPAPTRLLIPVSALALVREAAHEAIPDVSEAIDSGVHPRECCRRLGAVCDLLDVIGWSEDDEPREDVDAIEHASAAKEVAPSIMETLTTAVGELRDGDPEKVKAEDELRLLSGVHARACEALGG